MAPKSQFWRQSWPAFILWHQGLEMSTAEGRQLCAELGLQGLAWEPWSVSSSCFLETSGRAQWEKKRRRRREEEEGEQEGRDEEQQQQQTLVCQINIHAAYFLSKMSTMLNPCARLAFDRAVNRNKRHCFVPIKTQGKDAIKYFILSNISSAGDHLR